MTIHFTQIPKPDQEQILEIILEEFAENGYQRASTNAIVQKAEIPKGTLFYYFGSKKAMFLYTLDEAVKRFTEINLTLTGENPPKDLFEGLMHRMKVKLKFVQQEPLLYRFFYKIFLEIPDELKDELGSRFAAYTAASQDQAKEKFDQSKLKDGVDADTAVRLIHLMLEGLFSRYSPQLRQLSPEEGLRLVENIEIECRKYFELIREGIYR